MDESLVLKPVQIPSVMCSGTTVIELHEFNDKKKKKNNMDKMQKLILPQKWQFNEIFGTQITHDIFCAVKSLKVKLT